MSTGSQHRASPKPTYGRITALRPPMGYAWLLALAPLLWAVLHILEPSVPDAAGNLSDLPAVLAVGANVALAFLDRNRLERAGVVVSPWLAPLVPVYVVVRTVKARSSPAMPLVWYLSLLLAVLLMTAW